MLNQSLNPSLTPLTEEHIPAIADLWSYFLTPIWSKDMIRNSLQFTPTCGWISLSPDPKGFLLGQKLGNEGEVFGLVSTFPRRGLGSRLLQAFCQGLTKITLEVAEDNASALAFYHHHGFKLAGRRPFYYEKIDGLLLQKELLTPASFSSF